MALGETIRSAISRGLSRAADAVAPIPGLAKAGRPEVAAQHDLSQLADRVSRDDPPRTLPSPSRDAATERAMADAGMTGFYPLSPGRPLPPFYQGLTARQQQYQPGQNTSGGPRGETGQISFATLRYLAQIYDVARMCVNTRIDELAHLDFDIVPRNEEDKGKFDEDCRRLREFFTKPDGVTPFDRWIHLAAEDWLTVDALTVYRHRNRGGDKLVALEIIDGTLIKPLADSRGKTPLPPAKAYQQWMWGYPLAEYDIKDLIYRPYWVRSHSLYGFPPLEWLLLNVNVDLRTQWNFLYYFTQGNIPEGFGSAPEGWTLDQIKQWQEYWDTIMTGDEKLKRSIRWVPQGFKFDQFRQTQFDPNFPTFLLKKTCAGFGVSPQEIGFVEDINRAQGEMQENVQHRRMIRPSCNFLASVFDQVITEDFGRPELRFKFLGIEEQEDELKLAQIEEIRIRNGVISPDEVRSQKLGLPVDAKHPAGRIFMSGVGVTPIEDVYLSPIAESGVQPGAASAGNQEGPTPKGGLSGKPETTGLTGADEDAAVAQAIDGMRREVEAAGGQASAEKAVSSDLRAWRRKALGRLKDGRRPAVAFASDAIPARMAAKITEGLAKAATAEDVNRVFSLMLHKANDVPKKLPPVRPARKIAAIARSMADDIAAWFGTEAGRAAGEIARPDVDPLAALTAYDFSRWGELGEIVKRRLKDAHLLGSGASIENLKVYGTFDLPHPLAEAYAESRGAELVGKRLLADGTIIDNPNAKWAITESTRDMLRQTVERGVKEGLSTDDLAQEIQDDYAFSDWRAKTVARTETGTAFNRGSIDGYRSTGLVDMVEVFDGDSDPECQAANGQVWTLDYAEAHPLEHPNCVRAFGPVVKATEEE